MIAVQAAQKLDPAGILVRFLVKLLKRFENGPESCIRKALPHDLLDSLFIIFRVCMPQPLYKKVRLWSISPRNRWISVGFGPTFWITAQIFSG